MSDLKGHLASAPELEDRTNEGGSSEVAQTTARVAPITNNQVAEWKQLFTVRPSAAVKSNPTTTTKSTVASSSASASETTSTSSCASVSALRNAALPSYDKRRKGDDTQLEDIRHFHLIAERRTQQLAKAVADVLFESGQGDVELTTAIINKLFNRDEMRPFLLDEPNTKVTEKADAKRLLSKELYGALVAGQNTAETVKNIKVRGGVKA